MEMHQVRYFLAMARLLNFTRAADECNVTQPSLTRAMQKLEDELGGALFRRERRLTHLTDLGRLMLPHLERTYEAAEAAKQLAKGIGKAEIAPLALGIESTIESDALNAILGELGRCLPGFALNLNTGFATELLQSAMNGDLDLLIFEMPEASPERLDQWPLFNRDYFMVTRSDHPLALTMPQSLAAAREEVWIDHDGGNCVRLRAAAAALGFEPHIRHRATDPAHVRRLVGAGLGSAFMPRPPEDEELKAIRFHDAEITEEVVLAAVAGRKRGVAADAFVRAARARSWTAAKMDG